MLGFNEPLWFAGVQWAALVYRDCFTERISTVVHVGYVQWYVFVMKSHWVGCQDSLLELKAAIGRLFLAFVPSNYVVRRLCDPGTDLLLVVANIKLYLGYDGWETTLATWFFRLGQNVGIMPACLCWGSPKLTLKPMKPEEQLWSYAVSANLHEGGGDENDSKVIGPSKQDCGNLVTVLLGDSTGCAQLRLWTPWKNVRRVTEFAAGRSGGRLSER